MRVIADLHLHSKYSRAVSSEMVLPQIGEWAMKKGINLIATGDWTHPLWLREIKANLVETATGLYQLKERKENSPYFILSTEISSIYSQQGKLRRIHNLILAPSIAVVEEINKQLVRHGANLMSDGRPIIGLSAQELASIVFSVDNNCLVIPAHIWTPWFSLYGSESGFDSLDDCFGEMAKFIYAVETGLSSDPAMNWRISELDNKAIVSFSDAHSGPKLGREATVFELPQIDYENLKEAIRQEDKENEGDKENKGEGGNFSPSSPPSPNPPSISYTIEFYPEEGKYHYTGHRGCGIRQSPEETKRLGEICPVCGKHLTVGVMHRVQQLASRQIKTEELKIIKDECGVQWIETDKRPPYTMLVPLLEILAEAIGGMPSSQNVKNEYEKLVSRFKGEIAVLLKTPLSEFKNVTTERVIEAIKRVRERMITVEPGYDGVFGVVKIWGAKEDKGTENKQQLSFF
jgi:PHP family Zn ribbon phosphoesterase